LLDWRTRLISALFLKIPMSSILDTAEYRKLALIAAGVPLDRIPPILDTATWRHLLIAALLKNAASQVISGSVDYFSQLPTTIGSPAIGATWLVRNSSGIYYINYRSSGVYMKVTDTGSSSDWVYIPMSAIGTLPDVTLTDLQPNEALVWNGSNWINQSPGAPIEIKYTAENVNLLAGTEPTDLPELSFNLDSESKYFVNCMITASCPSNPSFGTSLQLRFWYDGLVVASSAESASFLYTDQTGYFINRLRSKPNFFPGQYIGILSTTAGSSNLTQSINIQFVIETSSETSLSLQARYNSPSLSSGFISSGSFVTIQKGI
jgi:hypothetical protein